MSLSFNGSQNAHGIEENWLFNITHSGGNLYLSLADVTYSSNFYYGAITNNPSIRESLDIVRSKANTSNITLTIADFEYNGSPISQEFFGGSNHYINRSVSTSIKVGSDNPVVVGTFRILDISYDGDAIRMQMAAKRPWDGIELPVDKSTTGVYVPVVYGNYSGHASNVFMTGKALYPAPRTSHSNQNIYFLAAKNEGSGVVANYYDSRGDMFVYVEPNSTATQTRDGKDAFEIKGKVNRTYQFRPQATATGTGFTNPGNAINTNTSDGATQSFTAASNAQSADLKLELPSIAGKITSASLNYSAVIVVSDEIGDSEAIIYDRSFGADTTLISRATNGTTTEASGTRNILSDIQNNGNRLPDDYVLRFQLSSTAGDGETGTTGVCTIKDVYLRFTTEEDYTNEPNAAALQEVNLDMIYSGNDGLTNSWDSSAITYIHDIHRDMLIRFGGVTTSTPDNYSNLNTSRSQSNKEWYARFWQLKPRTLRQTLEKIQFEGGFAFRFKADDSPQYIYVKDSYSSADYTLAKDDLANITVSNTSIADLVSKFVVNYETHPGNGTYINSQTCTNGTTRTNYNIAAKENIEQVNLDYIVQNGAGTVGATDLTGGSPNDGFANYYGHLVSNVKLMVEAEVINPAHIGIEVGDIVTFNNSDMYPEKAFGSAWTNKAFMVIYLSRTPGKLKIKVREVGAIS
tara:strand:- start:427 stop:2493 length:2067 start_codon:yes stop_codon:yes gene_type:complete